MLSSDLRLGLKICYNKNSSLIGFLFSDFSNGILLS